MKFKQGSSILYKADIRYKTETNIIRLPLDEERAWEGSVALFKVILQLKRGILDSLWYPTDIRLNLFFLYLIHLRKS